MLSHLTVTLMEAEAVALKCITEQPCLGGTVLRKKFFVMQPLQSTAAHMADAPAGNSLLRNSDLYILHISS